MKINEQFALLMHRETDYMIQNIIVCENYETASQIARATLGADAIAVETTRYPVEIGNTYINGAFFDSEGNLIEPNPTETEEIERLNATIVRQNTKIDNLETTIAAQDELLADILLNI